MIRRRAFLGSAAAPLLAQSPTRKKILLRTGWQMRNIGDVCFTPAMLGGGRVLVLPLQVYNATSEINWPVAAVGGLTLLVLAILVVALCNRLLKYSEA